MSRRTAFTLVEILVVLFLILILTAISVSVLPGFFRGEQVTVAASQLQGWLLEARQRAQRDQTITGLRLYGGGGTIPSPMFVAQVQLVQAPDPWTPGGTLDCQPIYTTSGGQQTLSEIRCTAYAGLDLTGGGLQQSDWPIQPGDSVRFFGGPPHVVIAVTSTYLDLYSPSLNQIVATGTTSDPHVATISVPTDEFDVIRRPRAASGEPFRPLASGAVLDIALAQMYGALLSPGPISGSWDILFSPSGNLSVGQGGSQGRLLLWVRQDNADSIGTNTYSGSHLIVSVRPTGAIAVDGLDQTNSGGNYLSPFSFTQSPLAGGF